MAEGRGIVSETGADLPARYFRPAPQHCGKAGFRTRIVLESRGTQAVTVMKAGFIRS